MCWNSGSLQGFIQKSFNIIRANQQGTFLKETSTLLCRQLSSAELPEKLVLGTLTPPAPLPGLASWSREQGSPDSLGGAVHYSHQEDTARINCIGGIKWGHRVLSWFWILFWQQGRYEDKHVKAACLDASPWNPSCNSSSPLFTMGETHPKQRAT